MPPQRRSAARHRCTIHLVTVGAPIAIVGAAAAVNVLSSAPATPTFSDPYPMSGAIKADSGNTVPVWLGGPNVDATHGYPLAAGEVISADLVRGSGQSDVDDSIYAFATANATLYILRRGS